MNFINNNKRSLQVDYEQHQFKRYKTPNSLSKDAFHSDLGLHLKHANDIILQLQSKLSLEKVIALDGVFFESKFCAKFKEEFGKKIFL